MKKGFTLIELLVVIAIISVVAGLSVPFVQSFQTSSDLYTHANTIGRTFRRAQQQAMSGQNAQSWSVHIDNTARSFTIYEGDNYATRDQAQDFVTEFPAAFSISNDLSDEVTFAIYSGNPSVQGTATITSQNGGSFGIKVNSSGLIQIQ